VAKRGPKKFGLKDIRLKDPVRLEQLRREGVSWIHPKVVVLGLPNDTDKLRVAFSTSRKIGKTVRRNRAKRLLREAVRLQRHHIKKGWDLLFIARRNTSQATLEEMKTAVREALQKANLWVQP